jgi:hypothetical protein
MKTLVPYHFINSRIVGWKCFECGQTFQLKEDESMDSEKPLLRIQEEFRAHRCEEHGDNSRSNAAVA